MLRHQCRHAQRQALRGTLLPQHNVQVRTQGPANCHLRITNTSFYKNCYHKHATQARHIW